MSAPAPQTSQANPQVDRPLPLVWQWIEAYFQRAYRIEPLNDDPGCLLAYSFCRHAGPDVQLQTGDVIRAGDVMLDIHFRRDALLPLIRAGDPIRMGIGLLKLSDRDVPKLARLVES